MQPTQGARAALWLSFVLGTLAYCFFYLSHPDLPGNSTANPIGWWGWFDQSQYMRAAKALTEGDFSADKHYYPPLYPAIGAAFLSVLPVHPFFFFNLFGLLAFAYVFMAIAMHHVSRWEALILLALSVYFNRIIIDTFTVPWTTTGTAAIYSFAIYRLLQQSRLDRTAKSISIESSRAFLFSGIFSLLIILRPVDAGAAAVFFPAYLYFSFRRSQGLGPHLRNAAILAQTLALGAGLLVGMGLFLWFNLKTHGQLLGGYFKSTASASGYFPLELPRKIFSLLVDANSVFLEPRASLISHFPWLILSIIGVTVTLARGPAMLRVIAAAICLQFFLYAPYGDLLPNGIWRYFNIHYFKWMFPYLALFAWLVVRWIFHPATAPVAGAIATRSVVARSVAVLVAATALLAPRFEAKPVSITFKHGGMESPIAMSTTGDAIDFIDIYGLTAGFTEIYFGDHLLLANGRALQRVKEFRLLPAPWGVRIFFNRSIHARELVFTPDKRLKLVADELTVTASSYGFVLGKPQLKHDRPSLSAAR